MGLTMEMTTVTLRVKNPKDESRSIEKEFLVDSGATFTVVPKPILDKIGIKPTGEQKFVLADGRTVKRKMGEAIFEMDGSRAPGPIVIGKKNDSFLLGTSTLEAMGLTLDPFQRKLYKARLML